MPRILSRQSAGKSFVNPLELHEGGTGKNTAPDALNALYGIPSGLKGQALGPVELNGQGRLDLSALEGISLTDTGIDGDSTIQLRETKEYFLTTYDSYQDYEVEGVLGVARIERNVIYYTAGQTPGIGGFIINGRRINILVQGIAMVKPSITVPVNNAIDRPLYMTFIGTSFQTLGGSDNHVSSDWELSTDVNFIDIVQRSYDDTTNLTSWAVTDMQELKKHYVRVRYKGQNAGLSPWSNAVGFTTGNDGIANTETGFIVANPEITNQRFGHDVSLSADGTMALVGAPFNPNYANSAGAVYYFKKINGIWTQQQIIYSPFPKENETFGYSVSVNSDATVMAVGCWRNAPSYLGKVYIFIKVNDIWQYQQKLLHPLRDPLNDISYEFGIGVAISGDGMSLFAGNHIDNYTPTNTIPNSGGAYYFTRSGDVWTYHSALYPPIPQDPLYFGHNCTLNNDGTWAVIGALGEKYQSIINVGAVYIYKKVNNVWQYQQKIESPEKIQQFQFGYSTCLSKDGLMLIVGSTLNSGKLFLYNRVGDTYVYDREIQLLNNGGVNGGASVAINENKNYLLTGVIGGYSSPFSGGVVKIIE